MMLLEGDIPVSEECKCGISLIEAQVLNFVFHQWTAPNTFAKLVYSSPLTGRCMTKPEVIFKLEHGFGPWPVVDSSVRSLPGQ